MERVSVVGLGYIGLPTAIISAQFGYKVFGFDVDSKKIEKINTGDSSIVEPEINKRLLDVLAAKSFYAYSELQPADFFIVAVPTPFKHVADNEIKKADLSYVYKAADSIANVLSPGNLVILESTVPVGTTTNFAKYLERKSGFVLGIDFFVAHCPERVLPGKIFIELVNNDRVIGGVCEKSGQLAKKFYSKFVKGNLFLIDDKSAEMVKLIENSSRDVQIAFANEVESMCKSAGINTHQVIECANKHPRVNILNPGCGVGGHCIAVDPWFLIESFPQETMLIKSARKINDQKPHKVIEETLNCVENFKNKNGRNAKVLALGLTFKPNIDDLRESPALFIAKELNNKSDKLELSVCEPNVSLDILEQNNFLYISNLAESVKNADIILILVKHKEFFALKNLELTNKIILDTCGLINDIKNKSVAVSFDEKLLTKKSQTITF